jgi:hypothetical protein
MSDPGLVSGDRSPVSRREMRVIAVSPGDVAAERKRLITVVEELNRNLAPEFGFDLKLWRWEADATPGLHLLGPQGRIDEDMRIEDADVVVGIFWNRLGTRLPDAESGTAHELHRAWEQWKTTGRPQVLLYFCERKSRLKTVAEVAQLLDLFTFREKIPPEQLCWEYESINGFEREVRQHLTRHLLKQGRAVVEIASEELPVEQARRGGSR